MSKLVEPVLIKNITNTVAKDLDASNIGGASVFVAQAGKTLIKEHFGLTSPQGDPVSDNTLFRLASMTKPITAVATRILVDRGLLSLEDTIDRFYPSFSSMVVYNEGNSVLPSCNKITIRNILTHSSGIGSGRVWTNALTSITNKDIESVDSFVDFLSRQPLSFEPGTKQEYSGIGAFSVLTGIIQQITGMEYEEFLKQELFQPLEMIDTTFEPNESQWKRLISMHDKVAGKKCVGLTYDGCVFEFIPPQNPLGGAGLVSSLHDYCNFAQMLLNRGTFNGIRVISEESVGEISKSQFLHKAGENWGLGVRVVTEGGESPLPVGCYGWSGAYGTHFWIDPNNDLFGIYMKNSRYDGGSGARTARQFEIDVYSALNLV